MNNDGLYRVADSITLGINELETRRARVRAHIALIICAVGWWLLPQPVGDRIAEGVSDDG